MLSRELVDTILEMRGIFKDLVKGTPPEPHNEPKLRSIQPLSSYPAIVELRNQNRQTFVQASLARRLNPPVRHLFFLTSKAAISLLDSAHGPMLSCLVRNDHCAICTTTFLRLSRISGWPCGCLFCS